MLSLRIEVRTREVEERAHLAENVDGVERSRLVLLEEQVRRTSETHCLAVECPGEPLVLAELAFAGGSTRTSDSCMRAGGGACASAHPLSSSRAVSAVSSDCRSASGA